MANEEHLKILNQGAKVWNRWREDNPKMFPNISGANLENLNLEGIKLDSVDISNTLINRCDLSYASFNNVIVFNATFRKTQLIATDFNKSNFSYVNLRYGSLEKANLKNSLIGGSKFYAVDLRETDFCDSRMGTNSFNNVDLSFAKGLGSVYHFDSSSIGIDTLYKSAGKISERFLRGCGIPDDFITFIPSHFGIQQAIQFYSCFISYSTKDEEFARRLYSRMRDEHLRVWFAPEDIKGGEKLYEQIEQAIQLHDRLLIILSEESMQSEWVLSEIRRARKAEIRENRRKLFPIRLVDFDAIKNWERFDADSGMDIAAEVRSYFIPDFSDWKNHDSFEAAFARLLRDLRAEEERQAQERA